jgi:transposase
MRKHNFAGHVNIITPQPREVVHSARLPWSVVVVGLSTLVVEKLLDPRGAGMYLYLHNPRQGEPSAQTDALRSVGALNPHPAAVKDEIFAGSDFFDRRDLVQVRYEMVRRVRTDGRPIAETATRFGVSRPTYYKLSAEFEREGICGLLPKKRGPKGGHKLRAEVVEALRAARTQDPAVDAASLVELVKRRFGVEIHARTIERALKKKRS